jgi:glucokinase
MSFIYRSDCHGEMNTFIGIDIGGTNTKVALVDQTGEISSLRKVFYRDFTLTLDSYLDRLQKGISDLVETGPALPSGIGISCPGLQMENGHGTLYSINMPMLNKFDLKEFFERKYQLPAVVSNDLIAHGLAESSFGVGLGVERFLSVSLGTGIGHAFFVQGKPQISLNGISGDSGRMIIDPTSDLTDSSGVSGSAEALCGVNAIEILGTEYYQEKGKLTAQEIITRAREQHDPPAVEIMSMISRRLALLLIDLSTIYFPEVISVTGGQTEAGEFFIEACQKEFDRRGSTYFTAAMGLLEKKPGIRIQAAKAGGLAGLIGSIVPLLD